MDVFLVAVGLFLVAEGKPAEPVDLLFLQAASFEDACGEPMLTHHLTVERWLPDASGSHPTIHREDTLMGSSELKIQDAADPDEPIAQKDWHQLLDMDSLAKGSKLRADCTGPDALSKCTSGGKPLLVSRLRLTAGTVSPIEYDLDFGVMDHSDDDVSDATVPWQFSRVTRHEDGMIETRSPSSNTSSVDPRRLYNGILFHRSVAAGTRDYEISFGRRTLELEPVDHSLCTQLGGTSPCMIAVVANLPSGHADESEGAADRCRVLDVPGNTQCAIDRHFSLNYLLLQNPPGPSDRLIPVNCTSWGPGEEPGETRCIPPKTSY